MDVFERTGRKDCVTVGMIQEIGDETGMENYRAVKEKAEHISLLYLEVRRVH